LIKAKLRAVGLNELLGCPLNAKPNREIDVFARRLIYYFGIIFLLDLVKRFALSFCIVAK
jgi:hypothetical protein